MEMEAGPSKPATAASSTFAARLANFAFNPSSKSPQRGVPKNITPERTRPVQNGADGPPSAGSGRALRSRSSSGPSSSRKGKVHTSKAINQSPTTRLSTRRRGKRKIMGNEEGDGDGDDDEDEYEAPSGVDGDSEDDPALNMTPSKRAASGRRKRSERPVSRTADLVEVKVEPPGIPGQTDRPGTDARTRGGTGGSKKSPKKVPRPYAGPEVYAHLKHVPDYITPDLDIVFCGINPGKKSATEGCHFAHPSNKFWKALYLSGITDRRVPPSEGPRMPELYNFGLTNLCDRPTAESESHDLTLRPGQMSELSTLEMRLRVPILTRKIQRHRPLVLCFVGKKNWEMYEFVVSQTAGIARVDRPTVAQTASTSTSRSETSERGGPSPRRGSESTTLTSTDPVELEALITPQHPGPVESLDKIPSPYLDDGLLVSQVKIEDLPNPYMESWPSESSRRIIESQSQGGVKLLSLAASPSVATRSPAGPSPVSTPVPASRPSTGTGTSARDKGKGEGRAKRKKEFDWHKPRSFRLPNDSGKDGKGGYTYFWVTPNTSGLERTPMSQLVEMFKSLKRFVEDIKADTAEESSFRDINVEGTERTAERMKQASRA